MPTYDPVERLRTIIDQAVVLIQYHENVVREGGYDFQEPGRLPRMTHELAGMITLLCGLDLYDEVNTAYKRLNGRDIDRTIMAAPGRLSRIGKGDRQDPCAPIQDWSSIKAGDTLYENGSGVSVRIVVTRVGVVGEDGVQSFDAVFRGQIVHYLARPGGEAYWPNVSRAPQYLGVENSG